jgi:hypothetical protein
MALTRRQCFALPFLVSGLTVEEGGAPVQGSSRYASSMDGRCRVSGSAGWALNQRLEDALSSATGVYLSSALSDAVTAAKDALKGRSITSVQISFSDFGALSRQ